MALLAQHDITKGVAEVRVKNFITRNEKTSRPAKSVTRIPLKIVKNYISIQKIGFFVLFGQKSFESHFYEVLRLYIFNKICGLQSLLL